MNKTLIVFSLLLFTIACMIISRPITVIATENPTNKDQKQTKNQDTSSSNNDDNKPKEAVKPEDTSTSTSTSTSTLDQIPIPPPPPPKEFPLPPIPKVNCKETPNIPPCVPPEELKHFVIPGPVKDDVKPKLVDDSCSFFPEQDKCVPGPGQTDCPSGFFTNEDGHCFKGGKCADGFFRQDDDESGTCLPKNSDSPKILCPEGITKNCVDHCPRDTHPDHFLCLDNKHHKHFHKVIHIDIRIHKHISSNNNPNSMVTKNTQLTPQLTVGEAIEGCKDVDNKSSNDLQKSCDIFMASTFNYCQTHQSIANKDHNICSDPLYKFVLNYLKVNNVKLKLFPDTIYNITP